MKCFLIFSFLRLFLFLPVLRISPYPSCHLYLPYLLHLLFQEIKTIKCIITLPDVKIKSKVWDERSILTMETLFRKGLLS